MMQFTSAVDLFCGRLFDRSIVSHLVWHGDVHVLKAKPLKCSAKHCVLDERDSMCKTHVSQLTHITLETKTCSSFAEAWLCI